MSVDSAHHVEMRYMTLDIVIDVAGATPQLGGLLVRALNLYGKQIDDVSVDFAPHDKAAGYNAIGKTISEHITALMRNNYA